jgi:hypothetical protein
MKLEEINFARQQQLAKTGSDESSLLSLTIVKTPGPKVHNTTST